MLFGASLGLMLVLQARAGGQGECSLCGPGGQTQTGPAKEHLGKAVKEASSMAEQIKTDADFETKVLNAANPVVVDFYADWCGPCKFLAPVIEEMAKELAGKADVYKVNVDDVQSLAARYGIQSIPTVIVFNGGQPAKQFVGVRGKEEYLAAVRGLGK
jgi:thioredoxin 1